MSRISHLLNRKPSVQRGGQTPDGQGGFTEAPVEVATPKGRRQAARGSDRIIAGREETEATHIWYFDFGADVKVGDEIVDGSVRYEVTGLLPPSLDDHVKVQTREIQHG